VPPGWKADLVNGDPAGFDSAASVPAIAGYPAVTVPVGLVELLPVGLTLIGPCLVGIDPAAGGGSGGAGYGALPDSDLPRAAAGLTGRR
jgi:hypothetical protein